MSNLYAPIVILLSLCFSPVFLDAQDAAWLEVGSEWTYQHGHVSGPEHFQFKYGITEETVFAGRECAKMEKLDFGSGNAGMHCRTLDDPYYFYESNDSLFFASEFDSTFRLVADFGATAGDSWLYILPAPSFEVENIVVDTFLITVSNVDVLNIDGHDLRELSLDVEWLGNGDPSLENFQELYIDYFDFRMIEIIGGNGFFAPLGRSSVCDMETSVRFQCFASPSFSYVSAEYDSCDQVLSIHEQAGILDLEVFPNPAREYTLVEIPEHWVGSKGVIQLHNSTGKLVFESEDYLDNRLQIPVENLTSGIYVLSISAGDEAGLTKLVVE